VRGKGGRGCRQGERVAIAGEERARGRRQRTSRKHGDAVEGVDGGRWGAVEVAAGDAVEKVGRGSINKVAVQA
jgi:hypothetical protein